MSALLVLSPTAAGLEAPLGGCTPMFLWPPTPTPTAGRRLGTEAYPLHRPRFCVTPVRGDAPQQGLLTRKDSFLSDEPNQPVKVKNTFIDGFLDEEEDMGGPAVVACKSWHVGLLRKAPELLMDWDLPPADAAPKPLSVTSAEGSTSCGSLSEGQSRCSTAPPSPEGPLMEPAAPPSPAAASASAARRPQVSAGAHLHGTGQCRPCGWFWKPEGCAHGAACCHCHLCPEGELKARKKAKLAALRARNPAASAQDPQ